MFQSLGSGLGERDSSGLDATISELDAMKEVVSLERECINTSHVPDLKPWAIR